LMMRNRMRWERLKNKRRSTNDGLKALDSDETKA
jgi:hypothetical protein